MRGALLIACLTLLVAGCGSAAQSQADPQPEPASPLASAERPQSGTAPQVATDAPDPRPGGTAAPASPATIAPEAPAPALARPTHGVASTPASAGQPPVAAPEAAATPLSSPPDLTALTLPAPVIVPPVADVGEGAALPPGLFERLRDDLATRLGADPAAISLAGSEAVTWPDGSLGCPQPGVSYTQAPVDGFRVLLELGGQSYDYRVGKRALFVLCR